uniref:Uncharacterized protein n=2 Tax=Arthrobacter sp. Chr15 TaxID=447032 RepID=A6YFU6_9MICC|nr:unknown [Arthrobacter sp. Chr15]
MVVGAYGIFDHPGHKLAEEPLLGTWQWRVSKATGKNVGEDSSRWNENLFKIYGIDPVHPSRASAARPASGWLNSFQRKTETPSSW